jgi:hypothetical protein
MDPGTLWFMSDFRGFQAALLFLIIKESQTLLDIS